LNISRFIVYSLLLFACTSSAQDVYRQNLTSVNGLPSNTIYDIIQDKNGFVFIATNEGVTRYDGANFKEFKSKNLSSKVGSHLKIDIYNRVWYETFDGFLQYIENDSIKKIKQEKPVGFVNYIITKNELIFAFKNGIEILNLKTLQNKRRILENTESYSYLTAIDQKTVLLNGNKSLKMVDDNKISTIELKEEKIVSPIYFAANNTIYIADKSNVNPNFYVLKNSSVQKIFDVKINATIQNIYFLKNKFWICTTDGLLILNDDGKIENHFLKKLSVTAILIDKDETAWIGTHNDGIFKIKNFDDLSLDLSNYKPLRINYHKGQIIIGNEYGELYRTDSLFTNLQKINFKATNEISLLNTSHPDYNFIVADGFYQTNKNFEIISHLTFAVKSISILNKNEIAFAATGLVGFKNISIKHSTKSEFDSFGYTSNFYPVLKNLRGKFCYHIPTTKKVLFATNNGLSIFENNTIKELLFQKKPLFIKSITSIDSKVLLISSDEKIYTLNNNTITLFSDAFEKISYLKKIKNELFLIATNKVYQWKQNNFELLPIDVSEKIVDFDADEYSFYCLLGKSLIKIKKNQNQSTNRTVKLILEKLSVNGKSFEISSNKKFNFDENTIEIVFSKVDFSSIQNAVLYKINDSDWKVLPLNANSLQLSSLSPDTYTISLKLADKDATLQKIVFTIDKPFWLQIWFLFLLVVLAFTTFLLFYKRRINTLSKKKNLEIEKITLENNLNENRLKLIKAQMNPHFFFNALNTIQSFIATNETEEATSYLDNFSKLTRLILEMTDKNNITIDEEIKMQKLYLELQKIRLNDFEFKVSCSSKQLEKAIIPTMILQPYIENAILHGLSHKNGKKKLSLHFAEIENDKLKITIVDNGIGLKKANEINRKSKTKSASFATKATLERLEIINRNSFIIAIETNELIDKDVSKGTEIIITMNLEYETI